MWDMVAVQFALVIVSLAVDMHKVEFVDQSVPLEQLQGSIDRAAIDAGIQLLRLAQSGPHRGVWWPFRPPAEWPAAAGSSGSRG